MEIQQLEVGSLRPWDNNPRDNDHAVDAVAESIKQYGFNVPILCDRHKTIIAGHVRWKAAKKLGMNTIPAIKLSLTPAQRKAFAIADNKTAEIADWNYNALADLLKELPEYEIDLSSLGFTTAELDAILKPEEDFDWSTFQDDLEELRHDETHALIPVKVPINMLKVLKGAIRERARQQQISFCCGKVFGWRRRSQECWNRAAGVA